METLRAVLRVLRASEDWRGGSISPRLIEGKAFRRQAVREIPAQIATGRRLFYTVFKAGPCFFLLSQARLPLSPTRHMKNAAFSDSIMEQYGDHWP